MKRRQKGRESMSRLEELLATTKLNDMMHKKEEDKAKNTILWVLAIIGDIAAVAGIAALVYKYLSPDYLDDVDEDFEDDFDDDFFDDDEEDEPEEDTVKEETPEEEAEAE